MCSRAPITNLNILENLEGKYYKIFPTSLFDAFFDLQGWITLRKSLDTEKYVNKLQPDADPGWNFYF